MRVIGIDCATEDSKVGIALGEYQAGRLVVTRAEAGSRERSPVATVARWLEGATDALLAIDAPLGWPAPLARVLHHHNAGAPLAAAPNDMFRRETDRFIQREIGKTPLDVGADRIARTAHRALGILEELRQLTGASIPLAWASDDASGIAAIEVYPAATLLVHGARSSRYKDAKQVKERDEIVTYLRGVVTLPEDTALMAHDADVLDAVVCLVAAKDFLDGRSMPPVNADLARQEGWIWVAPFQPHNKPKRRSLGRAQAR